MYETRTNIKNSIKWQRGNKIKGARNEKTKPCRGHWKIRLL